MTLRYGIIGCGSMGREHLLNILALPQGGIIAAISDTHQPSLDAALKLIPPGMNKPQVFSDYQKLLESGVCDAVIIATPNFTHFELMKKALATDLHILIEKPLCTNVRDCQELIRLSQGKKQVVWVAQEYRYMPPVAELITLAHDNKIGALTHLSIKEHREPFYPKVGNWNRFHEKTGGTMVEKCCHYFNLMEFIFREQAVSVYATSGRQVNYLDEEYDGKKPDMIDSAFAIVDFESGAKAMLDLCMYAENTADNEHISLVGDKGKLESLIPSMVLRYSLREDWGVRSSWEDKTTSEQGISTKLVHDKSIRYPGEHYGASYVEHLHFSEAIINNKEAEVTLQEGMRSVAIGEAAHKSMAENRPVKISEVIKGSSY